MNGVSMVITTYNRGELLRNSMARLAELTIPDEILIIDDGGDDETEDVCGEFAGKLPIRYIYNNNPGKTICSMARNIGVRRARAELIITSEPELIYHTDIVRDFLDLIPKHPRQVITAGEVHFAPEGWNSFELPPPGSQIAHGWVAPFTALYRRQWLAGVGGWDESFPGPWGWDDTDLLTRLRLSGVGQHIAPECVAVHQFHGLGADRGKVNERHFLAKSFHRDESDHSEVVANEGAEWGRLRSTSA